MILVDSWSFRLVEWQPKHTSGASNLLELVVNKMMFIKSLFVLAIFLLIMVSNELGLTRMLLG